VLPLQILMFGLVFSFLSFPVGALLNACNKQSTQTTIVFFVLVANVILNLILIPRYTVIGAAISATVANILLTLVGYYFTSKLTKISHGFILKAFLQVLLASLVMATIVWQVNLYWHYLIAIIVGALTYTLCLFIFKIINQEQIKEALILIKK
jgi:O-antigen/teichoic acid export membrane protein